MAKKKTNSSKIFNVIALLLGIVALAMLFLSAVKIPDTTVLGKTIEGESLTGLQVAFGYSENDIQCLSFSVMGLLPWVLILVGVVFTLINSTGKKGSKLLGIISALLFIGAGVIMFFMPNFMVFAETISGLALKAFTWNVGIGAIIAGISSILAGILSLVDQVK